ncbi:unnamed protein product [Prunus armeniaca]
MAMVHKSRRREQGQFPIREFTAKVISDEGLYDGDDFMQILRRQKQGAMAWLRLERLMVAMSLILKEADLFKQ